MGHSIQLKVECYAGYKGEEVPRAIRFESQTVTVKEIVDQWIGPDHRYLIPATALAGAMLLILADAVARVVVAPSELPAGILTALLGTPFFFSLLAQKRRVEGD